MLRITLLLFIKASSTPTLISFSIFQISGKIEAKQTFTQWKLTKSAMTPWFTQASYNITFFGVPKRHIWWFQRRAYPKSYGPNEHQSPHTSGLRCICRHVQSQPFCRSYIDGGRATAIFPLTLTPSTQEVRYTWYLYRTHILLSRLHPSPPVTYYGRTTIILYLN